jgi:hypothetical protein
VLTTASHLLPTRAVYADFFANMQCDFTSGWAASLASLPEPEQQVLSTDVSYLERIHRQPNSLACQIEYLVYGQQIEILSTADKIALKSCHAIPQ